MLLNKRCPSLGRGYSCSWHCSGASWRMNDLEPFCKHPAWLKLELQCSPASFYSPSRQFWPTGLVWVPCGFYSHVLWVSVLMKRSTETPEGCVLCVWISSPMLGLRTGSSIFLFSGLLTDLISSLTDSVRQRKFEAIKDQLSKPYEPALSTLHCQYIPLPAFH